MSTPKHFSRTLILLLVLALPLTMAMVAAPSETSLVKASCARCHSLSRVCKKLGQNEQAWQKTLTRMQAKGAAITDSQIPTVAAFLSTTDSKASGFCD